MDPKTPKDLSWTGLICRIKGMERCEWDKLASEIALQGRSQGELTDLLKRHDENNCCPLIEEVKMGHSIRIGRIV